MDVSRVNTPISTDLLQHAHAFLRHYQHVNTFVVALSGGTDSMALVHLMSKMQKHFGYSLLAVHVNHGLHAHADQWQGHCENFCQSINVPLEVERVTVERRGKGLEAEARTLRYQALHKHLTPGSALLTAHHRADQAETVLLNLFRGAGVAGLAAMPIEKRFGDNLHLRPLLDVNKRRICDYVAAEMLVPVEDPSNQDVTFSRNFVRHQLMPLLWQRWPRLSETLFGTAARMQEASELLDNLASDDLAEIVGQQQQLSLNVFREWSFARQKNALRYWLSQEYLIPTSKQLDALINDCINAGPEALPEFLIGEHSIRRYRDTLYLLTPEVAAQVSPCSSLWSLSKVFEIESLKLTLDPSFMVGKVAGADGRPLGAADTVEVRFRRGGELLRLREGGPSKTLKNLFQERGLPPWQRDKVPLIYHQEKLVAVWGFTVDGIKFHG